MIISIKRQLMQFFSPEFLLTKAKNCGFIKRERSIKPYQFLLGIVSAMSKGNCHSIADIHRQYNGMVLSSKDTVAYKPFHNQLRKDEFAKFMKRTTEHAMHKFAQQCIKEMPQRLACFDEIHLQDGCCFRVHDKLENIYPCRFKKIKAGIECHMTMSLMSSTPTKMTITADTESEHTYLPEPHTLKNKLELMDAGYVNFKHFDNVDKNGGFFICRGKKNANPVIIDAVNGNGKKQAKIIGKKLKEVTRKTNRAEVLDMTVKSGKYTFRVIRYWFKEEKRFCLWYTNLPRERFSADDVMRLYRLRWQIELLFKELKSHTNWRRFNTEKKAIVDGLVWASLLALIIRRYIALQLKPNVSFFKMAKNVDIWLLPIFLQCIQQAWTELTQHLEWVKEYLNKNTEKAKQRKSIRNRTLDGILESFNS